MNPTHLSSAAAALKSTTVHALYVPAIARKGFSFLEKISTPLALWFLNRLFAYPKQHRAPSEELLLLQRAKKRWIFPHGMSNATWRQGRVMAYHWPVHNPNSRVMLVHGWEGRATQFHAFIPALHAAGIDVIALDAPAHGKSDGRWSSLFHFSHALERVANYFGGVDSVITHSFGGAALIHAMNDGLNIQKSVLIAPPIRVTDYTALLCSAVGVSEKLRQRLHQQWQQRLGVDLASLDAGVFAQHLRQKACIIHDQHDKEVPFCAGEEIASQWANASLFSTTNLGHRRILKDPQVIDSAVRFITQ